MAEVNKIVFGKDVLIDLTSDTVTPQTLIENVKAHNRKGEIISGTIVDRGNSNVEITSLTTFDTIPEGYYNGQGSISLVDDTLKKYLSENVREGVTILGVEGTLAPGYGTTYQEKTVTPSVSRQEVIPDEDFDGLSKVIVMEIPYREIDNSAGGQTAYIISTIGEEPTPPGPVDPDPPTPPIEDKTVFVLEDSLGANFKDENGEDVKGRVKQTDTPIDPGPVNPPVVNTFTLVDSIGSELTDENSQQVFGRQGGES